MPIDRGPWNALVDDDGSNLVGSVWNKDKIKTVLLDPIDAAFGMWTDVPYNAADFTVVGTGGWLFPGGSLTTYAVARIGNVLLVALYLSGTQITGTPTYLQVRIPGGLTQGRGTAMAFNYVGGTPIVASVGYGLVEGGQIKILRDMLATPFTAGNLTINGVFTIFL